MMTMRTHFMTQPKAPQWMIPAGEDTSLCRISSAIILKTVCTAMHHM